MSLRGLLVSSNRKPNPKWFNPYKKVLANISRSLEIKPSQDCPVKPPQVICPFILSASAHKLARHSSSSRNRSSAHRNLGALKVLALPCFGNPTGRPALMSHWTDLGHMPLLKPVTGQGTELDEELRQIRRSCGQRITAATWPAR